MIHQRIACAALLFLLAATSTWAQGGGASQTGTIDGRVTDASGGLLPGATVTIASPALIGQQTTVTSESGAYRFPAVPPGAYAITYELPGFATLTREGIQVALGFTATVNVQLALASVQESITVSGRSPVIDTSATRVQQNFKLDALEAIPNARDMWSLLAITPSVQMGRIDVGGNRAGTQTAFVAFGFGGQDQQVRVLVEGINTTEGTGGAGFYFDFGSFEEVFLGTAAQGAEMPFPGVQSQFLGKSGGKRFAGQVYLDYENSSTQGSNISASQVARGVRPGGNEIEEVRDFNVHVGGPLVRDRLWGFASWRNQFNAVRRANFRFDKTFDTELWNPSGKLTYQLNQHHKFVGYYQWGQKIQPNRPGIGAFTYLTADDTLRQDSGSWVWKGEWNGTLSNALYVETRYGVFGYYFPLYGYSDQPFQRDGTLRIATGGDQRWQQDRDRKQLTGAATYFKDSWLGGNHTVKVGGEINFETQWNGFERVRAGHIEHWLDNGVSTQVVFDAPTASGPVGSKGARADLLAIGKLDHHNAFVNDQWAIGRGVSLYLGVRFDHYKSHVPEQRQLAFAVGPLSVPDHTFAPQTFFTWNKVAPRLGLVYDLSGDGRTVAKVNYGYFGHNPGPGLAAAANPNQAAKTLTYTWSDRSGDKLWQPGEEGTLTSSNLAGAVLIDPAISQPYTHEAAAFLEQQISEDIGARVGFVYKTNDNLWQRYQALRPPEAYTVPFTVNDIGPDGISGTGDDRPFSLLGAPLAALGPPTQVIQSLPAIGRYKSIETALSKRFSQRWSVGLGFGYSWIREHNTAQAGNTISPSLDGRAGYPNTPNDTSLNSQTTWSFKAHGMYHGPRGIHVAPVFRHQSGQNYGRTITVQSPAGSGLFLARSTILAEPLDSRRMDTINVLDVRAEKVLALPRSRVRLFVDVFNLFNSNAAETIVFSTGPQFQAPIDILGPRVARVGFRFEW